MFIVKSKTERTVAYTVDMTVGVCTCPQGIDGSPCSHQAAVSIHYDRASINCISTLAPSIRQIYAQITLRDKADTNLTFYASLHDSSGTSGSVHKAEIFCPDFTSSSFDLIRSGAKTDNVGTDLSLSELCDFQQRVKCACLEIDKIADDLKKNLEEANEQLLFSIEKFSTHYGRLKGSIPLLTSSLHRFGWTFGGTITSRKGGGSLAPWQ